MIRLVLLVLSIVALDKAAQAGMTVTVSDTCTAAERAAEKPGPFDGNMVIPGRAFAPQDLTIHEPGPQTLRHPCAMDTVIHPVNAPSGPAIGTTEMVGDLNEAQISDRLNAFYGVFQSSLEIGQAGASPFFRCAIPTCPLPDILAPTSGILMRTGASGGDESLGAYLFINGRRHAHDPLLRAIPFVVLAAHEDDWLEFSNRGTIFWKAPVTDFKLNQLYFAVVPESAQENAFGLWGYYLNDTLASASVVYVPTFAPPPPLPQPVRRP